MKDKTITLRIPLSTFESVDWIAVTEDRSFNAQVKRILAEYIGAHQAQKGESK